MRPGPIGPGIERLTSTRRANAGFNEAGANWPRNFAPGMVIDDLAIGASMRPGPIGPGIAAAMREVRALDGASMRPGPIGPGIKLAARKKAYYEALQ